MPIKWDLQKNHSGWTLKPLQVDIPNAASLCGLAAMWRLVDRSPGNDMTALAAGAAGPGCLLALALAGTAAAIPLRLLGALVRDNSN